MRTWRYIHLGEELSGTILQVIDAIVQYIWEETRVQDEIRMEKQSTRRNQNETNNSQQCNREPQ